MKWAPYETEAMGRALALARRGRGAVEPNPMVGAVIVRNGKIIAEGYHHRFGAPHAEVGAIKAAGRRARGAEMFVSLEPCCHYGKTPPCTDAIIAARIARVVVAMKDPFEKVHGKGIARLRSAGVKVETGLFEERARILNAPFIKLRTKALPWVIAKYAMTLDGNIAAASGDSHWISCDESRRKVHRLRGLVDAIVVGAGTALADDPLLTARPPGRRTPARVILDSRARLSVESKLVGTVNEAGLIVAATKAAPARRVKALRAAGAEVIILPGGARIDVVALGRELAAREMTNILVEGGAEVLGSFFAARLVDECVVFVAPTLAG
ncbi:MAG: bifunctional diaminohydroxyphosphoribosylaminopyrimidine deaminase/5-amino-6-(5-phosphoribosylamino)uracil reductase RibD, partial [Planctomycetes bacterium]|nr:bifunctional diaminohydroxyphosphoribosylaminopyrimidine deaminase/5-amino-6-(5-phosphoribosylamino)uracil reductase RibD [Planctomycetota bacterium]